MTPASVLERKKCDCLFLQVLFENGLAIFMPYFKLIEWKHKKLLKFSWRVALAVELSIFLY